MVLGVRTTPGPHQGGGSHRHLGQYEYESDVNEGALNDMEGEFTITALVMRTQSESSILGPGRSNR